MANQAYRHIRLIGLHQVFNRGGKYTVLQLMEECGNTVYKGLILSSLQRIVQDDVKSMYSDGIENEDIVLKREKYGRGYRYYYPKTPIQLKTNILSTDDLTLLTQVISMLDQTDLFGELKQLRDRVQTIAPLSYQQSMEVRNYLFFDDRYADYKGRIFLRRICDLIALKTPIKIKYQSFLNEPIEIIMHPYSVREYNMRFYVCGAIDGKKDRQSNLALDRIIETPEAFNEIEYFPNPFNNDYYDRVIGLTIPDGRIEEQIDLAFSPSRAPYVITKPIHQSQKQERVLDDGRVLIRLNLIRNQELESIILNFGKDCEVLAPASLRQSIQEQLKEAATLYSDYSK